MQRTFANRAAFDEASEPRHHRLDQREIATFPMHGAAIGAEIVLHVDDQDCGVLRTQLSASVFNISVPTGSRSSY